MGKGKNPIFLSEPEIVSRMVLMMMGVDHCVEGRKLITDVQKVLSAASKTRVNEKPIHVKGKNLEERDAGKSTRHVD
jgi:hypothetical protein